MRIDRPCLMDVAAVFTCVVGARWCRLAATLAVNLSCENMFVCVVQGRLQHLLGLKQNVTLPPSTRAPANPHAVSQLETADCCHIVLYTS